MFNNLERKSVSIVDLKSDIDFNGLMKSNPVFRTDNGEMLAYFKTMNIPKGQYAPPKTKMLTLKKEEQSYTITFTELD